ncbi:hypothetical protein [Actinocrispum sp. NPDC049592]|uniref:hypothetical protein n=1 Tax=Actinocrispum sp. NPDC049592 TaxID=3154835 RepID=UPI00342B2904
MTQPMPRNALGRAGFACALAGAVGGLIPVVGLYSWLVALTGVGLCSAGIGRFRRGWSTNYGLCVGGIVLAVVGMLMSLGNGWISIQR